MLKIDIKASGVLAAILGSVHIFSLVLLWAVPLPFWAKLVFSAILMGSAIYSIKRNALLAFQKSIIALQLHSDCKCEIQKREGGWVEAELLGTSFVAPYLTLLNFKLPGKRFTQHIVILPDAVDSELFRQLRVLLKWKCNRFPREKAPNF